MMQSIQKSLLQIERNKPKGIPTLEEIKQEILESDQVKQFLQQHPDLDSSIVEGSLSKLDQTIREQKNCEQCTTLAHCPNLVKGHKAHPTWTGSYIEAVYTPCAKWIQKRQQKKREELIKSHHIPHDVLSASFQNFTQDAKRIEAFRALLEFCLKAEPGSKEIRTKGIYLYGPLGVGKSHLMAATARKLADRGISSLMVYTPDFFREMKESLQDNSLQEKVAVLKNVPVLILDDIGAESISPWARDEILGAILQYRITENLPTLYTSNYNYELLEEHFSHSAKGGIELMKAKRIMERIIHYTNAYMVDGINRRANG